MSFYNRKNFSISPHVNRKKIHRLKPNRDSTFTFVWWGEFHSFRDSHRERQASWFFRLPHMDTPNCAGSVLVLSEILRLGTFPKGVRCLRACAVPALGSFSGAAQRAEPAWRERCCCYCPGEREAGEEQALSWDWTLLCGDKFHNHADDPGSSRTCTQIYAWVFYLILEELVKFTTEFLY